MKRLLPGPTCAVAVAITTPAPAAVADRVIPLDFCCRLNEVGADGALVVSSTDDTAGRIERLDPANGAVPAECSFSSPPNGDAYFAFTLPIVEPGAAPLVTSGQKVR